MSLDLSRMLLARGGCWTGPGLRAGPALVEVRTVGCVPGRVRTLPVRRDVHRPPPPHRLRSRRRTAPVPTGWCPRRPDPGACVVARLATRGGDGLVLRYH